ncbi:MAG: hypothetical protein IKJ45_03135, partial [Kiritimatiellae bacterium]|nr:hypothetical protein [Kiritimatiellia bacterium]
MRGVKWWFLETPMGVIFALFLWMFGMVLSAYVGIMEAQSSEQEFVFSWTEFFSFIFSLVVLMFSFSQVIRVVFWCKSSVLFLGWSSFI